VLHFVLEPIPNLKLYIKYSRLDLSTPEVLNTLIIFLYNKIMINPVHLQVRNPKDDETPIESASQIFASLLPAYISPLKMLFVTPNAYSFEIFLINQLIYFYVTVEKKNETLIQSLITSSFTNSIIKKTKDPMEKILTAPFLAVGEVKSSNYYLPHKTYMDFKDVDPLSSVVGFLSKRPEKEAILVQILVSPATFAWADSTVNIASKLTYDSSSDSHTQNPQKLLMMRKAGFQGGKVLIRLLVGVPQKELGIPLLQQLAGTFGTFSLGEGSQFHFEKTGMFKQQLFKRIVNRSTHFFERRMQILNAQELASIWHPPGFLLEGVKNIAWGKTMSGEPPENLPVAEGMTDEQKKDINFFAKTTFKNKDQIFGIRTPDRRKHVYIIGKTGAGKSTLIANMAIDDIRRDRAVGIIDPHGDLTETIIDYIPKRRINDVVYLEPFDPIRPFRLNVLEIQSNQQKDLVASGIVSIFYKLYGDSWGPRLEYILRNVIITLLEIPGSTLVDVMRLLSDTRYRIEATSKIQDPVVKAFWEDEFARMPDRLRAEAVSPIQNKVGQFVTSTMIRNVIGHPKSTINLADIMDGNKIMLLNLSQGKLGEDNAALLGAMVITQLQLAAMARSYKKEEERKDFILYVDEFQNFATTSFIKILSEARKYHLSLSLANQYIDQLEEEVHRAVFGNIGTLISFVVGARDAYPLSKEFGEIYSEADMVSLGKYEIVLKLSIENMTSAPFPAKTLPLPKLKNNNRESIIRLSKEKYGRPVK